MEATDYPSLKGTGLQPVHPRIWPSYRSVIPTEAKRSGEPALSEVERGPAVRFPSDERLRKNAKGAPGSPQRTPDFLSTFLALAHHMRLS
jgi:hypothetical protein